jgi:hypothetical protein
MDIKRLYDEYQNATSADFHEKRDPFLEAVQLSGVDASLDALGFSKDREGIWYNVNTGSERTLAELLVSDYGATHSEAEELSFNLENWLPKTSDLNPVIARAKAMTEADAMEQVAERLRPYSKESPDHFADRIKDQGGTLEDGYYTSSPRTKGKVHVELHDGREFLFGFRDIYHHLIRRAVQPALF